MNKYPVRTSAKAIIIHENRLLAMKHQKGDDVFFTLPGGGQNHNEDLHSALKRECLEEAGADVKIKELFFVRDYIADNHEFAHVDPGFHQVEFMFLCEILNPGNLHPQTEPDTFQIGMEWLRISSIEEHNLYPLDFRKELVQRLEDKKVPVYLGDIN